jgi:hypothetical protein
VCNVSFVVCIALCAVFCLNVVSYFMWYAYFCVFCLIVVLLPPGKNPFAVQLTNDDDNNNNNNNNNLRQFRYNRRLLILFMILTLNYSCFKINDDCYKAYSCLYARNSNCSCGILHALRLIKQNTFKTCLWLIALCNKVENLNRRVNVTVQSPKSCSDWKKKNPLTMQICIFLGMTCFTVTACNFSACYACQ